MGKYFLEMLNIDQVVHLPMQAYLGVARLPTKDPCKKRGGHHGKVHGSSCNVGGAAAGVLEFTYKALWYSLGPLPGRLEVLLG
jgi:hypothetical protein